MSLWTKPFTLHVVMWPIFSYIILKESSSAINSIGYSHGCWDLGYRCHHNLQNWWSELWKSNPSCYKLQFFFSTELWKKTNHILYLETCWLFITYQACGNVPCLNVWQSDGEILTLALGKQKKNSVKSQCVFARTLRFSGEQTHFGKYLITISLIIRWRWKTTAFCLSARLRAEL